MAKNIKVEIPADFSFEAFGHTLTADHLTNWATLAYLIGNGFKQSLSDAAAMSKADMAKAGLETDADIESAKADKRAKRFEAILAGDVSATGTRLRGIDAYIAEIGKSMADAFLSAKAKREAKTLPAKSSDDYKALVAKVLANETFAGRVRAEAEKRMAEEAAMRQSTTDLEIDF